MSFSVMSQWFVTGTFVNQTSIWKFRFRVREQDLKFRFEFSDLNVIFKAMRNHSGKNDRK